MIELCSEYLLVRCIWLYVIIMSRASFRVNLHAIVCRNVKKHLTQSRRYIWILSDSNVIRTHNHLVRKRTLNHLAKLAKWLNCVVSTFLYGAFDCMLLSQLDHLPSLADVALTSSKEFLDIQANYRVRIHSETRTWHDNKVQSNAPYRQYSQHNSIIWPVWLNGWVFLYKLSSCGFESCCCHLKWFCAKVCPNDFYSLQRSIVSSWIHIGVKRISQACCVSHLKNMIKNL